MNKIDALKDKRALLPRIAEIAALREFAAIVPVSAERGTQLDALKDEIAKLLPEGPPLYGDDELTDRDERFLAAEFVREKIFRLLGDEVPYATTVTIDASSTRASCGGSTRRSTSTRRASARSCSGEGGARMKAIAIAGARRHGAAVRRPGVSRGLGAREERLGRRATRSLTRLGY